MPSEKLKMPTVLVQAWDEDGAIQSTYNPRAKKRVVVP